ncbi:hypothetical protein [Bacillus dakarensis]|uniref:hypothetical protein n=1 Tax=Robertmurraya dakarensis TaxID=1926278 RepID=UPI0009817BC7|nr:hypothetical protein [Bacillus dakarensis]
MNPMNNCNQSLTRSSSSLDPIIDNGPAGFVQLGINPEGHLNVPGVPGVTQPSFQDGTTNVGLRFIPTNGEATAPGCLCEGWGVANNDMATGQFSLFANVSVDGGPNNMTIVSANTSGTGSLPDSTATTFTTLVNETASNRVNVTHDYHPSASPNLYQCDVTITNTGTPIGNLLYRRVMDWDIPPTTFSEWVEINIGTAVNVLQATNDGFASANPLAPPFSGSLTCPIPEPLTPGGTTFYEDGPCDQGALFDFQFGALAPGESRTFTIFYGGAVTKADALLALSSVGAEVYSLGLPTNSDGSEDIDGPNVFIFAFRGVGGKPIGK